MSWLVDVFIDGLFVFHTRVWDNKSLKQESIVTEKKKKKVEAVWEDLAKLSWMQPT